jgi:hypothetical protein
MRALRTRLRDRRDGEPLDVFLERQFQQFEAILERYRSLSLFDLWRRPGRSGRPRDLLRLPPKKRGRRTKFTPDVNRQFVGQIEKIKASAARRGEQLTDARALQFHLRIWLRKRFVAAGHPPDEAHNLAEREARKREASPRFSKNLRERLSRARQNVAKQRR